MVTVELRGKGSGWARLTSSAATTRPSWRSRRTWPSGRVWPSMARLRSDTSSASLNRFLSANCAPPFAFLRLPMVYRRLRSMLGIIAERPPSRIVRAACGTFKRVSDIRVRISKYAASRPRREVVPPIARGGRNVAHRALGERRDCEARVHAEIRRDHGPIADIRISVTEQAVALVDHTCGGGRRHRTAAQDVGGSGGVEEDFRDHAQGHTAGKGSNGAREPVRLRHEGGDALAAAHQDSMERPEPGPAEAHLNVRVLRVHAEQNQGLAREAEGMQTAERPPGMASQR